ncbi:MAG TPA: hypothetical protein VIZ68_05425 [Thermoplasmata archaeon]
MASTATSCSTCGYPTALALDALRALSLGEPTPVPAPMGRPAPPARRRGPKPAPPDPQGELCQRIAQDTDAHLGILQELGGDTQDVASDLRQAALAQADGQVVEALDILRRALGRVQEQGSVLFERRVREMEERDDALRRSGVGSAAGDDAAKMREMFQRGRRLEAIALLRSTDQFVARIEGDWKGLEGLLRQVDTLREAVRETGQELPEVDADVQAVRELVAGPAVTIEALDKASQTASRALMTLQEALPKALHAELSEHDRTLARLPEDHAPTQSARQIHGEALRQLRRGRLPEASASLRQLRAAIRELRTLERPATKPPAEERRTPPPEEADAPTTPVRKPEGETADYLSRLLGTARSLAARVRTLPPESEIAFEAAAEIRLATELLRARKLDEAEETLTRLMQTLDAENAAEA